MSPKIFFTVASLIILAGCQSITPDPIPQEVPAVEPIIVDPNTVEPITKERAIEKPSTTEFSSTDIVPVGSNLQFTATIPAQWQVEYIPDIQALNFYDPTIATSTLEQSQIFVRTFAASDFLTLQTVTIHSQTETTINGRPAVVYDIEKKAGVADFVSQPTWRSQRHFVTDIRSTYDATTTFYVFGKRPNLDQTVFDEFINSVEFK